MFIAYRGRDDGMVTLAMFHRHTMSRTMRRYPAGSYEIVGCDLSPECIRLASAFGVTPTHGSMTAMLPTGTAQMVPTSYRERF